jgi:hypothetical protein
MKKIIVAAIAALCMTGFAMAQTTNPELNDMFTWLVSYYGTKDLAYQSLGTISEKVKAEFPMDQKLADAVNAVRAQGEAAQQALATKYGFATYDAFYMDAKYHPEKYGANGGMAEIQQIYSQTSTTEQNLTKAYTEELTKRIQSAEIEAIKRIQENAKAMK